MEVFYLKPATLLKVTLFHGCFSRFLNCANDTKSRKASHMFVTSMHSSARKYQVRQNTVKTGLYEKSFPQII